jgi:hypothetical protein
MNYYINCIHCGITKLKGDEIRRYAMRGESIGIVCPNCSEEATLLKEITSKQMWEDIKNHAT